MWLVGLLQLKLVVSLEITNGAIKQVKREGTEVYKAGVMEHQLNMHYNNHIKDINFFYI